MRSIRLPLAALGTLLFFGHAVQATDPSSMSANAAASTPAASEPDATLVARGEYVARLGDCLACHTADKGPAMAGGRELATPFGKVFSTNITPDKQTGIGHYSFEQFDSAMRKGVAANGHNLYPAMPYPSYAKISEDDMHALYAYFQRGVTAVNQPNKPAEMRWPYSMRWGLMFWNWAFLDDTPFKPDTEKDAVWNRGAYLVQGLGHCGSCHTPRGIGFQEKAMSEAGSKGKYYLAGATVEAWHALSLRNLWTVEDTALLLKTGQNRFSTVSGSMVEVIHLSSQHFSDDDLIAIATYLKSLPRGEDEQPAPSVPERVPPSKLPDTLFSTRGGLAYVQFCSNCHRDDGGGVAGIFPPLVQNPTVASADPTSLLHITLIGSKTAQTATHPRVWTMPGFARLSDQEVAEILGFLRGSWGNNAKPVTPSDVAKIRAELDPKVDVSKFETPRLADMLAAPNAAEVVRGMRMHLETRTLLPQHVGDDLTCNSCHLNAGTVADGSPFVGVSAFFPSYAPRAGKIITLEERINGCFRRSMNGVVLPLEGADLNAMVAYFDWMKGEFKPEDKVPGRGIGKVDRTIKPDVENGKRVYVEQCAACHGNSGEGLRRADGTLVFPPLWGDRSFNIGAGMARTYTAAAFVKRNMPIGFNDKFPLGQGGLSDQDAVDVAAYFSHMPRPDFPDKVKDWPKDPKPSDARLEN
jgi:thiosulfate dehydrogenase